ncbi:MAG: adenylate/guanylate cyclase domain-containing protein, partial [Deltaproteobacteria bacterium]|nr:adenylate/guanylate cyclase domain-containing protein [Deltaproteobacteria bacterium]
LYHAATDNVGARHAVPLPVDDPFTIRFAGPPPAFKTYSAVLVAKGLVPTAWLENKIVLIGAGYADLKDAYHTPYYAKLTNYVRMNGVEVHANILNSLLTQQFYTHLTSWQQWLLIFVGVILIAAAVLNASPWKSSGVYVIVVTGIVVGAVVAFQRMAIIVPIVVPFTGATVSFGLGLGFKALTEGRQKRWIKGVFSQYVPRQVVDRMVEHPDMVKLGGEKRIVTSLFSDIESFTTISEKLDPETLVKFLNDYLGKMNAVLFQYGATIDKYEGDAIIAFFNAPLDVKDHETAAVKAALGMQQASREVTEMWKNVVGRDVVTRIGVNTGPAVIGNMGSADRFDYTAIGDTINLASRLEGTNKTYNTRILCSEITAKALPKEITTRFVDRIQVKGKEQAVGIYEVIESSKGDL